MILQNTTTILQVVAFDADEDQLRFLWSPPPFALYTEETAPNSSTQWTSRILLQRDEALHNQQIELLILDDDERAPATVSYTWNLVVP